MIKQLHLLLVMLKSKNFFKVLGILFLAVITFLIWELSTFVLTAPQNSNADYIPSDARWTIRMDGNAFFKESFSEAFLTEKENEIVDIIQELVENRTASSESVDLGIDFLSDIYISSIKRDEKRLVVFTFNLRDSKKFTNLQEISETGKIAISSNKKVGVLVVPILKNSGFSSEKLAQFAQQLVKKTNSKKPHLQDKNVVSSCWINTKEFKGDLNIAIKNTDLKFDGYLNTGFKNVRKVRQLEPNGFHISYAAISGSLKDTLSRMLKDFMPSLPSGISSVSLNYRGSEITTDKNMMILPDMDVLLGYDNKVSIQEFLDLHLESQSISKLTAETFECAGKTYYYAQVDDLTIYVGRKKPTYTNSTHFLLVSGNPSSILTLRGDDSYLRFARLMPTFLATENFIHSMQEINLSISDPKNGKSSISGTIHFSSGATPIGSILTFLVRTEVVK